MSRQAHTIACWLLGIFGSVLSSVEPTAALSPAEVLKEPRPRLGGNDIGDIVWADGVLYVASDGFISKSVGDGARASDWVSYDLELDKHEEGISALWARGDTLWVGTSYSTEYQGEEIPAGNGLRLSVDGGVTWRHFKTEDILPDSVRFREGVQFPDNYTTCYDIASVAQAMWFSFTSGFAVRTRDLGKTWGHVLPDTSGFHFRNPNHHGNALVACGDTIWVGTFGGIHRSTDGGETWIRYDRETTQGEIPGNFIPALGMQRWGETPILWAGVKPFEEGGREGISYTRDSGATWVRTSLDRSAWNFAFRDSIVWATTEGGLFRTDDFGAHWTHIVIEDPAVRERIERDVVGIEIVGDTLWVGSEKGLARSTDLGETWTIIKVPVKTRSLDEGVYIGQMTKADSASTVRTYAFPNPFSPAQHGVIRIQYSLSHPAEVTIRIYDFASRPVKTLIEGVERIGPENHGENWDGKNDAGEVVANGVYFYRIETDREDRTFGEIVVLE